MLSSTEKKPCKWTNVKGNPCSWRALPDKKCCKRHSRWEDISPENSDLKKCSGCKNLFITTEIRKTCDKCKKYAEKDRKKEKKKDKNKDKKKCVGFNLKTKLPCKHFALDSDDYCGEHQKLKKFTELSKNGKVCTNWIRGCFNILDENDKSACKDCKKMQNEKDRKRYKLKQEKAISYNLVIKEDSMCIVCNSICKTDETTNKKCQPCYTAYKIAQKKRNPKDPYNKHLWECKSSSKKRNLSWELTDDTALELFKGSCHYCGHSKTQNGIDRKNNNLGYITGNVVSCCSTCNMMKYTLGYDDFFKIINIISLRMCFHSNHTVKLNNSPNVLFKCAKFQHTYNTYINNSCKNRNLLMNLNEEQFYSFKQMECYYCGYFGENKNCGIDRLDSSVDYTIANCIPCCTTCNFVKRDLPLGKFKTHVNQIYTFNFEK